MELRNRTIGKSDGTMLGSEDSKSVGLSPRRKSGVRGASTRRQFPLWQIVAAWLVHLYTASGLLVNMYSLHALFLKADFSLFAKLNWLAIAIDATDGTFARAVDIKNVVPSYDGALLDNIIDFQTFSVLPALAVIVFDIVPGLAAQYVAAGAILIASAYQFCQTVAKTPDAFVGFPSYWNIVIFYIYYLRPSPVVTFTIIFGCAILSFVPIHFIYPTRTKEFQVLNLAGAYVWATLMLVPSFMPNSAYVMPALYVSFVYVLYYIALSIALDVQRRKHED